MTIYNWIIIALWLALIGYWAISAVGVKRNTGGARAWWREIGLRLGALVLILFVLRISGFSHVWRNAWIYTVNTSMLMGLIGLVLCALGVGLAVAGRAYLGRNWGMPMSRKQDPELVTSGPYAVIRHPIYSGLLLAMLGSAIGVSVVWMLPLIFGTAYFIYSARREEKLMTEQFPEQYPAYKRRTKMLVPYVL